jgi:hypothetical protein
MEALFSPSNYIRDLVTKQVHSLAAHQKDVDASNSDQAN